jgi:trimeric autotransporter adhesin
MARLLLSAVLLLTVGCTTREPTEHTPLVLDLAGDGISVSTPEDGVVFDLRQSGMPVQTAWPRGDDALLAMDRDGDGVIGNGGELFGNAFATEGNRFNNGFEMLAHLDRRDRGGNDDGVIDTRDTAFEKLVLWRDRNRDGISGKDELTSMKNARIVSIGLQYRLTARKDAQGNKLALWGTFEVADAAGQARELPIVDVWFQIKSVALRGPLFARMR